MNIHYAEMVSTRRRFLEIATGTTCAACLGTLSGCADPSAPSLPADVEIRLSDYPSLADVGGVAQLGTDITNYDYPIFLRNEGNDEFSALSAYCNHQGCSVRQSSNGFRCPCHGATFDENGNLLGGPATADLLGFDTMSDGMTLTIFAG